MSASSKPVPLAIPNELHAQIERVAKLTGLTRQAVIRLAISVGLEDLRRCDYDLASAVVDAAHRTVPAGGELGLNEISQDPPPAGSWRVSQVLGPSKYPAKKKAR